MKKKKKSTPATAKKTTQQKSAKKNKKAPVKKNATVSKKVAQSLSNAIMDSRHLDQVILDLAAGPYNQFLKQIEKSKKKLDQESRVALLLGSRILEKARNVRDQLVQQAQKVPGVAYVAQKTTPKNQTKMKNTQTKSTAKKRIAKKSKRS